MSKEEINEIKEYDLQEYLEGRGHEFEKQFTLCPFHADSKPSLTVDENLWFCHSCRVGGSIIDYVSRADGLTTKETIEKLKQELGVEEKSRKEIARYEYTDEHGNALFNIIRYEPKDFIADRKMDGIPRVPYRFDYVCESGTIFLVEGEKDADNLMDVGIVATTMPFGVNNWKPEDAEWFTGKHIIICLDKGRIKESQARAHDLLKVGVASVKILDLEGLKDEEDVTDWLENNSIESLLQVAEQAETFNPTGQNTQEITEDLGIASMVREFVEEAVGWFKINEIYNYIGVNTRLDKQNVSKELSRQIDKQVLVRHPRSNGLYRKLDKQKEIMDWKRVPICPIDIKLPLGIDTFFATYPNNIFVFAGTPDAGKTAYFLDFVKNNMEFSDIHYFNSEMSDEELKLRIQKHQDIEVKDWSFEAVSRVTNFADVIDPNGVNIIDYMELGDEIYKVGLWLRELHDRLDKGIAIVGLQKPYGRELGYGKELALQIPRLYVSLEYHKRHQIYSARIVKCKNRKDDHTSMIGKIMYYKIFGGWKLEEQGAFHYYGEDYMDEKLFGEKKRSYS